MKDVVLGAALLFGGHAVALTIAWWVSADQPFNAHVLVAGLLGMIQVSYAVPLLLWAWRKRRPRLAAGALGAAVLTAVVTTAGLLR